jgi:hypothetical protein
MALLFLPGTAMAQANNELNPNINEGASINSNADNTHPGQEFFVINDSGIQVFFADGDVQTIVSNANNVGLQYDTDNNGSGTFALTTGGANVLSADNAGTVTVHNSMIANGINNGNDGITNAGAVSGVTTLSTSGLATLNSASVSNTLGVSGATTLNNTLGVSGATTLNNTLGVTGATTMNNTLAVDTNGGTAGGTRFTVDTAAATIMSTDGGTINTLNNGGHVLSHVDGSATNAVTIANTQQTAIGANTFSYGTQIDGGLLVEGDLGVNGSIYALNSNANTGINVGNNGLDIDGANNTVTLIADSNNIPTDGRGVIMLQEDQASFLVYNQTTGQPHGLVINQSETVLSGGTQSTSLTLDDNGARFRNTTTGGAARVTGVAAGSTTFDAVNFGQLRETNAGVASVAAMANMPGLAAGKNYSIGLGFGNFEGESAFAFGGIARLDEYVSLQASVGHSNEASSVGAGVGFSW